MRIGFVTWAAVACALGAGCKGSIEGGLGGPAKVAPPPEEIERVESDHWAFNGPTRAEPPSVEDGGWISNEIDAFVLKRLREEGREPAAAAPPEKLLRRVSLALTGLPPTLEELDAFLADPSDEAYGAVVDRLLTSPRHAEHMTSRWLDLARYADTDGYQYDGERPAWPYRDWVLEAYDSNLPFDEFTIQQLAGDMLPDPTEQELLATSFNRNHPIQGENGLLLDEFRDRYVADRIDTLSRAWLGLTMGCARCHDHKYDPTKQDDYYRLYDCFNQVPEADNGPRSDFAPSMPIASPLQESLATELAARVQTREAEGASNLELEWLRYEADQAAEVPLARIMQDEPGSRETHKLAVGRYDAPFGDSLRCGSPHFLSAFPEGAAADRMGLAKWLLSPDNPLTARVVMNRLWHQHFGRGLVGSVDNFGIQTPKPEYLELLDWLALRFIDSGWDLKAMHRMIVTSSTYRQSSTIVNPEAGDDAAVDPDNTLLARGPRFRLAAEVIRDMTLATSGLLVERRGGPPVYPYQPAGLWEELAWEGKAWKYPSARGDGLYRRSLYTFWKRALPPPFMSLFDAPDREQSTAVREPTTTAEQALALMNGTQFLEAARHLADRVYAQSEGDVAASMALAFRMLTSRLPNEAEAAALMAVYEEQQGALDAQPAAVPLLQESGHSQASTPEAQRAALTQVMRVLLNLGETITQE